MKGPKLYVVIGAISILIVTWIWHNWRYRTTTPPQFSGVIVIPGIFDVTGSLDYMGDSSIKGAQLAVNHINMNGGLNGKQIVLGIDDAESNNSQAVTLLTSLIEQKSLPIVIGLNSSGEVMSTAPIATRSHFVLFSTGAASPSITHISPYVFRNRLSSAVEASKLAEIAVEKFSYRRAYVLYIDNDYGKGYVDAFKSRFIGLGGTIAGEDTFAQDSTDFRIQISKIKATPGIDFICLASHTREGGRILRQAHELGISTHWMASNAVEGDQFAKIAGNDANGVILTVQKYDPDSPTSARFNDEFRRAYSKDSDLFAANAYDAVMIIVKILEGGATTGDDIRNAMSQVQNYSGVSGLTSFDKNGDVIKGVAIRVFRDGKFVNVEENALRN